MAILRDDPTDRYEHVPGERELAARAAVVVQRMYDLQGWTWGSGGSESWPPHVPNAEEIAQTIEHLIANVATCDEAMGASSSGRLMVMDTWMGRDVFLHLGSYDPDDGEVDVDDVIKMRKAV